MDTVLVGGLAFLASAGALFLINDRISKSSISPRKKRLLSYLMFAVLVAMTFGILTGIAVHILPNMAVDQLRFDRRGSSEHNSSELNRACRHGEKTCAFHRAFHTAEHHRDNARSRWAHASQFQIARQIYLNGYEKHDHSDRQP